VLIPHRRVYVRHALAGALLATILIELAKRGFALYIAHSSYEQMYGAIAIVPIFIFWIYLSWVLVLLGASVTASLAAFDYRPPSVCSPAHATCCTRRWMSRWPKFFRRRRGLTTLNRLRRRGDKAHEIFDRIADARRRIVRLRRDGGQARTEPEDGRWRHIRSF